MFLAVLAVVGLLTYGLLKKNTDRIDVGATAPDRSLPMLSGTGTGQIADYRGKWVLVNLWASWCVPCGQESPALERFYRAERANGFTVLGVDSQDIDENGRRFVDEHGITYPQLYDGPGDLLDSFGSTGFPESFLVNPQGKIALVRPGPVTPEYLHALVLPLIDGEAKS
jgi:cytochrome c biogenesis protein CcmG/thiol:disulfide interchange protein DsbE